MALTQVQQEAIDSLEESWSILALLNRLVFISQGNGSRGDSQSATAEARAYFIEFGDEAVKVALRQLSVLQRDKEYSR